MGLEPDAEALIVNRIADPPEHAIAPIDECYRLVGMIKIEWDGISGGAGVERAIETFFGELRERAAGVSARVPTPSSSARRSPAPPTPSSRSWRRRRSSGRRRRR